VTLTVRELTEIPYLRTRLHAGAAGRDRPISWAHSIEVPRPWEWLEAGDLLMTVGLGIPSDPAAQVEFVESLAAIGASGMAIGENMHAPPLTDEMIAAAERRSFPILITAFEVPFVQVSRTIAASSHGPEHLRLVKTVRIYDSVRAAVVRSSSAAELLRDLGREIDCALAVCTNDRAVAVFPGADDPEPDLRAAFLHESQARGGVMPGILRVAVGDRSTALAVPVPSQRPASLLAVPRASEAPPYAILQHVATIAALELERLTAAREELRRLGSETMAHLIDGRLSALSATSQLAMHGLADGPLVVLVVARPEGMGGSGWMHHALAERGIPNMLLRRNGLLHCLTCSDEAIVEQIVELLDDDDVQIGISDPFTEVDGLAGSVREARWALDVAQSEGRRICRYGEQFKVVGPRSITEARAMVERVLGPVLAYDRERDSELVPSLAAFLRCNRSWQQTAAVLFVHKQTLVYRMRRVEELTGRKLADTSAIAELWPAICALEIVGDLEPAAAPVIPTD
jgi:PucR family transcriptional regulator, purine catabolism regulatory protein